MHPPYRDLELPHLLRWGSVNAVQRSQGTLHRRLSRLFLQHYLLFECGVTLYRCQALQHSLIRYDVQRPWKFRQHLLRYEWQVNFTMYGNRYELLEKGKKDLEQNEQICLYHVFCKIGVWWKTQILRC